MEVIILASGSKGNALLIKINGSYILIDLGITYPNLVKKLKEENIDIDKIESVLITHEHTDHIRGLKRFLQNHPNINIYISKGTFKALDEETKKIINKVNFIKANEKLIFNKIQVETFELSHDANEPIGFVISADSKKIVLATDTGYIDENYFDLLRNAQLYILEANHDPALLMNSNRPYYLKQRIIGTKGHLSNNEAAWLMNEFIKEIDETTWVAAHISEDCNTEYHIEKSIVEIIEDPTKINLIHASQEITRKIIL